MPTTPDPEPTNEEAETWLATPEGAAVTQKMIQDSLAGKYGELPPELITQARRALRGREVADQVSQIHQRMMALTERLAEQPDEWPENSRWAHVRALNHECKAIMDLVLELPEPHSSSLMKKFLPFQQMIEKVERETE